MAVKGNDHNAFWHHENTKTRRGRFLLQPQRDVREVVAKFKEGDSKLTVYKFSNLLIKNTSNVGLIKNNGKGYLFLQELLELHLELRLIFFKWQLHFLSMQYLLQLQLRNPCLLPVIIKVITEADQRDGEVEGTSYTSMKLLSAVVNSL